MANTSQLTKVVSCSSDLTGVSYGWVGSAHGCSSPEANIPYIVIPIKCTVAPIRKTARHSVIAFS